MKTISAIGKTALTKMFKPVSICNAMEMTERSVVFPKEEFDIRKTFDVRTSWKSHEMSIHSCGHITYYVWSLELGLHVLDVSPDHNMAQTIVMLGLDSTPSHVIFHRYSFNEETGTEEVYTCYRLTQKQEELIESTIEKIKNFKIEVISDLY